MRTKGTISLAMVAVIAAWMLLGHAGAEVKRHNVLRLTEHSTESGSVDNEPAGPSLGDVAIFSGDLERDGETIGTFDISCVVTSIAVDRQLCSHSWSLPRGTIEGQATIPADLGIGTEFEGALTGGTGKYDNVRGYVSIEILGAFATKATLHLMP